MSRNSKALKNLGKRGGSFEKAVAAVQKMMDPKAKVVHNQKLKDIHGHWRQFDVVIRVKAAGRDLLGVIECKDSKTKKVGTPEVDAFVTKARGVNASITLLASKRGFTKPALEKARHYGIGTISLLPKDRNDAGFFVGQQWYAQIYTWAKVKLTIHFVRKQVPDMKFSSDEVTWRGQKVIDWFHRELVTTYRERQKEGGFYLPLFNFDKPRRLHIGQKYWLVKGLTFQALRVCQQKTKWVQISGKAFYDWNKKQLTVPPKGTIETDSFKTYFSDWEEYVGEIPPPSGYFDFRIKAFMQHFDPNEKVPDLLKL